VADEVGNADQADDAGISAQWNNSGGDREAAFAEVMAAS
jgi:hypothetical protein